MQPHRLLRSAFAWLLALLIAGWPMVAGAQSLRVTLRDSLTGAPVVAALVAAIDADGAVLAERLGNRDGDALLPVPRGGPVRVRIRRIGLRPVLSQPVNVAASGTTTLVLRVQRIEQPLPTVGVVGRDCRSSPRAEELWERMTIALQSAALRDVDGPGGTRLASSVRHLTLSTALELLEESAPVERLGVGRAFIANSATTLLEQGYVRADADGTVTYSAPDDAILASDDFRRLHCFTTPRRDARQGVAEVRFTPAPSRRDIADISGSAFIDTASGEPRRITFRYEVPYRLRIPPAPEAGGEVVVRKLDDGSWIVSAWSIRMPIAVVDTMAPMGVRIDAYREVAGLASPADEATIARIEAAQRAANRPRTVRVAVAVLRDDDLEPVPAATLALGTYGEATADAAGLVSVVLPADTTLLLGVSRPGYTTETLSLRTGIRDTTVIVRLRPTTDRAASAWQVDDATRCSWWSAAALRRDRAARRPAVQSTLLPSQDERIVSFANATPATRCTTIGDGMMPHLVRSHDERIVSIVHGTRATRSTTIG